MLPVRPAARGQVAAFGLCDECGAHTWVVGGACRACEATAELAAWQAYAEKLESVLHAQAEADKESLTTETTLTGGTTMKHQFRVGARITLIATLCPVDDTTDGEDEHEFRDEPAVVVEHLNGDPAADYLVYVPKTRRVYPCVPADMARL